MSTHAPSVLVVGNGIIGMTVARVLRNCGSSVHLHSSFPISSPKGASQGAGGLWMPFHCEDGNTDRWARTTLLKYLTMIEDEEPLGKHIELMQATIYKNLPSPTQNDTSSYTNPTSTVPTWATLNPELNFQSLGMSQLIWQSSALGLHVPEGLRGCYTDAWMFKTPIVDTLEYLKEMEEMCVDNGVEVNDNITYPTPSSVISAASSLGCGYVVNCTGLGSSTLLSDHSVVPARGVLHYYTRPPSFKTCIIVDDGPEGTESHPKYVIPRGDVVAVGGCYLEGDEEEGLREEERSMLSSNARLLLPPTSSINLVSSWVGHRPVRAEGVSLGLNTKLSDDVVGVKWIDNYGHGGSGWTVAEGCAEDVRDIIQGH